MKKRTAKKVIKYGMYENRGKFSSFNKAITTLPQFYEHLSFAKRYEADPGKILKQPLPDPVANWMYND